MPEVGGASSFERDQANEAALRQAVMADRQQSGGAQEQGGGGRFSGASWQPPPPVASPGADLRQAVQQQKTDAAGALRQAKNGQAQAAAKAGGKNESKLQKVKANFAAGFVKLMWAMVPITWGHTVYIILDMHLAHAMSRFFRTTVPFPGLGNAWFPAMPAPAKIGLKIAEGLTIMLWLMYVLFIDFMIFMFIFAVIIIIGVIKEALDALSETWVGSFYRWVDGL